MPPRFARLTAVCACAVGLCIPASARESLVLRASPLSPLPLAARFDAIAAPTAPASKLFDAAGDGLVLKTRPDRGLAPEDAAQEIRLALMGDERRALALALADRLRAPAPTLERRRLRAKIAEAYAARDYAPLWAEASSREAVAKRLHLAGEDGLDLRDFPIPAVAETGGALRASDELDFSEAVAAYVAQARGSRIDPESISPLIGAKPEAPDVAAALTALAGSGAGADEMLRAYNPPHYGCRLLREKLAELRRQGSLASRDAIVEARDAASLDDSGASPPRGKRGRERTDRDYLEGEILANMERWRWLPRDLGADHVEINIPEFELAVVRGGAVTHRTRVIVGKEATPTPIFSNAVQYVIVNPAWNVPESILVKEMHGDVGRLAARGWKVRYAHGKTMVQQPPGPGNALGQLKIMFPNDFSVYMHDTPSRGLFSARRRAFSHGCMRVQEPFALAEAILGPDSGWSQARLRRLIGASERYVTLKTPLPIHIEYFTAFVDEYGRLQQREDIYGHSAKLRRALGWGG